MRQPFRLPSGGLIDRSQSLRFTFNGKPYWGFAGDTLASALLANGVHLVARSVKYHRPRGIMTAGVEEPNAIVQVGRGAHTIPDLKATEVPLYAGLHAMSVNVFPSVGFDVAAALSRLSRFMPAGFYYKTFFGSQWLWQHVFEPLVRQASGWGAAPSGADPDAYDRRYHHCDVLVVGAGAAGLAAAYAAGRTGARVALIDEGEEFGGSLLHRTVKIGRRAAVDWVRDRLQGMSACRETILLPRTSVFGYYDGNCLVALQRRAAPGDKSTSATTRQRIWHFRAPRVVLATGAHERPLVFANNDRPGIMLAGAVQAYVNRWAVLPGRCAVVFTNNDRGYEVALDLAAAGAQVAALVDARRSAGGALIDAVRGLGIPVKAGHAVVDTRGYKQLTGVSVAPLAASGHDFRHTAEWLACDLLAVSGGLSPVVHLHSQAQGKLLYDATLCCFRPVQSRDTPVSVGACNGTFTLHDAISEGIAAGREAATACGFAAVSNVDDEYVTEAVANPPAPLWLVPPVLSSAGNKRKHFVDLQNDTTAADIHLAVREGFESVEHVKRFTLTGFGTDQGKTSNINGLVILAEELGAAIPDVGTTTFRPPYTPVTFGAMAGRDRGELFDPARLTPIHDRHVAAGAVFEDVGQWKRPWYYPRDGECMDAAVSRECLAVRQRVGMIDASTLGKIDIQGPDAAEFLDRIYTNNWLKLPIGKIRYGVMCREDGMVFDDGTTARIGEHRYLMTTTTGNAAAVLDHLEEYLQTEWPELRVRLTSVTEQWATIGIAGPMSRRLIAKLTPDLDLTPEGFPFLAWRDVQIGGISGRIFRISFTGELQYEINVPWQFGAHLWDVAADAGKEFDVTPYGTETMHVLRAEKGFIIIGQETDGTQTPYDLGLDWAVSQTKDFVGRRSMKRRDCVRDNRKQLVGLLPADKDAIIEEGTQLVAAGTASATPPVAMQGFVTSSYWSAVLGRRICLALVAAGKSRHREQIEAATVGGAHAVTICDPVFYDREGKRRDGFGNE